MPAATYPLRVEWTLVHEIYFYVLLTIFLLTGKAKIIPYFAAVWIVITLYVSISGMALPRIGRADFLKYLSCLPTLRSLSDYLSLYSLNGLRLRLFRYFFCCTINSATSCTSIVQPSHIRHRIRVLVLAAVQSSFAAPRFIDITLHKLGDWSYAMYLVHVSIFVAILPILDPSHDFLLGP